MNDIAAALARVRARIAAAERDFGRATGSVRLVAVSKAKPPAAIRAAFAAGQRAFGESYAQEAVAKIDSLPLPGVEWHFVGPLQSNKTRAVATRFSWVHSIDRLKIARRLNEQRPAALPPLSVCIEVNLSGEPSKSGVAPGELPALADAVAALPNLRLRGLMSVPRRSAELLEQRAAFRGLRELFDELRGAGYEMDTLSMGMSADLEAAVAEGATVVRIGTAIFGAR